MFADEVNGITVLEWLRDGKQVSFAITTEEQGELILSGKMYIQQFELTGEMNGAAIYSFNGPIDGPLSIDKLDIVKPVYLSDLGGVRLPGCPNPYPVGSPMV